jgi:hypothetical protein
MHYIFISFSYLCIYVRPRGARPEELPGPAQVEDTNLEQEQINP